MKAPLGKLERTPLRKAWAQEAGEFTPWLAQADNLTLLAESLGLSELELVGTEHPVGDFKVDILCTDDGGKVIIEGCEDIAADHVRERLIVVGEVHCVTQYNVLQATSFTEFNCTGVKINPPGITELT